MAHFIGLMSGTSLDGVDAVLAAIGDEGRPQTLAHACLPLPAELAAELLALNQPGDNELHRSALAANALMQVYARAVAAVCAAAQVAGRDVAALGAHGQTVRHQPGAGIGPGYTTQLVNGALLAELTGVDTVCDFRSRDVAAGGQGAPLVPAFHAAMFATPLTTVALLNVGGIANVTLLEGDGRVLGYDTGPGNLLMDHWATQHLGRPFDRNGHWASQGQVDAGLLERLRSDAYFRLPAPKSTGRDLFHASWLNQHLGDAGTTPTPVDVMATLAEFTASTAADAVRMSGAQAVYVCGGGASNAHVMGRLAVLLPGVHVSDTAALGVPPQQVEALAFAWLAWAFTKRKAGNLPAVTGATGLRVLGALYPR